MRKRRNPYGRYREPTDWPVVVLNIGLSGLIVLMLALFLLLSAAGCADPSGPPPDPGTTRPPPVWIFPDTTP